MTCQIEGEYFDLVLENVVRRTRGWFGYQGTNEDVSMEKSGKNVAIHESYSTRWVPKNRDVQDRMCNRSRVHTYRICVCASIVLLGTVWVIMILVGVNKNSFRSLVVPGKTRLPMPPLLHIFKRLRTLTELDLEIRFRKLDP